MNKLKVYRVWIFIFACIIAIIGVYAYWLKNVAPQYGAVLMDRKISENGVAEFLIHAPGLYGANLVMDQRSCEKKNGYKNCNLYLEKKYSKCLVDIKGAHKIDKSGCGDGKGRTANIMKMKLADFYINQEEVHLFIDIGPVSSIDSAASVIEITREPESNFTRIIHPGYYRNQIIASIFLLAYPSRYLILSIVIIFFIYKIWRKINVKF